MKLFKNLLALLIALTCVFAVVACDNGETEEELDTTKFGWAFEYDIDKEIVEDEDGNEVTKQYVVITGLFLADGEKYKLNEDDYETLSLEIGNNSLKVPEYDAKDKTKVVYDDNGNLKTKTITLDGETKYDGFKIADAAFANQVIIGSVTIHADVKEIASSAFAGCTSLKEMTIPYVGATAGENLNAKKLFAHLFGTAEAGNCTAVTCKYNQSGTATYYVPNSLKKVTVNLAEGSTLPAYAFNGVSTLETIVVNNANKIGNYAFEGCSGAYTITIPGGVTEIGVGAFKSCAKLINFDFPASLTTIYQEAFSGCSRLGYGKNTVVELANVTHIYDKAFYNCTSLSSVKMPNAQVIGECAFYGCTSLETCEYKAGATVGNDAFGKCPFAESDESEGEGEGEKQ